METRTITVISTKTSSKYVFESNAVTLADLKRDLRNNNIDYSNMTFYEGLTKTELIDDASILPTNVPYKGTTTNNLTFMLTNTNKKIKSGAIESTASRAEVYTVIQAEGLQSKVVNKYGRNYTQVPTASLIALINDEDKTKDTPKETPKNCDKLKNAFKKLVETLYNEDWITTSQHREILNILEGNTNTNTTSESPYSQTELDNMFDFIK